MLSYTRNFEHEVAEMSRFIASPNQTEAVIRAMRIAYERGLKDQDAVNKIREFVGRRTELNGSISRQSYNKYRRKESGYQIPFEKLKTLFYFFSEGDFPILRGEEGEIAEGKTEQELFLMGLQERLRCESGGLSLSDCQHLCYSYELYRKSWITEEPGFFVRSLLRIEKEGSAFLITETSKIPAGVGEDIIEIDKGWIMPYGTNFVAFSNSPYCMKFFVIHDYYPDLTAARPVLQLGGNYMAVSGKGPHPSFKFMARRSPGAVDIGHFHKDDIQPDEFQQKFFATI